MVLSAPLIARINEVAGKCHVTGAAENSPRAACMGDRATNRIFLFKCVVALKCESLSNSVVCQNILTCYPAIAKILGFHVPPDKKNHGANKSDSDASVG